MAKNDLDLSVFDEASVEPSHSTESTSLDLSGFDEHNPVSEDLGTLESGVAGAAQGLTLGFGDEISGGLNAAIDIPEILSSDKTLKQAYTEARDIARGRNKQAQEANPISYGAGQFIGGVAPAVASGGLGLGLIGTGAALGGLTAAGSSEADLTEGEVGQLASDTTKGAVGGAALSAVLPNLLSSKILGESGSIGQYLGKTATGAGLGAAGGGALGGLLSQGGLSDEAGRDQLLEDVKSGAALGGGIGATLPTLASMARLTPGSDKIGRAFQLGKEGVQLVGKKAKAALGKSLDTTSEEVSQAVQNEIMGKQIPTATKEVQNSAKAISDFIRNNKSSIGAKIGAFYDEAAKQNKTLDLTDIIEFAKNEVANNQVINAQDASSAKNLIKFLQGQLDKSSAASMELPLFKKLGDASPESFRALKAKIEDIAYKSSGIDVELQNLARGIYKKLSERGLDFANSEEGKVAMRQLNKLYSNALNAEEFAGATNAIVSTGAEAPSDKLTKLIEASGGVGDVGVAQKLENLQTSLQGIDPTEGANLVNQAKQASKNLIDINDFQKFGKSEAIRSQIPGSINPQNEAAANLNKVFNTIKKTNPELANQLQDKTASLAERLNLAGEVGDAEIPHGIASIVRNIKNTAVGTSNLAGQAWKAITEPAAAQQIVQAANSRGYNNLARIFSSMNGRDAVGRSALMFTIYQNPELRKNLEDIAGDSFKPQ